ncbi:MAG: Crp/Fnr family transcriptional regulator [Cocleimonas sp.]|nr:Crp/Fnr family transcriptional regulator [Cocleimonas sp.]
MPKNNHISIKTECLPQCASCRVRERALYKQVPKDSLANSQQYRKYQLSLTPKTTLYSAGTRPEFLYTLYEGWMALYQSTSSGKRQIICFSLPGDFIGFQANGNGNIMHSAFSLTNATLCAFPRSRIKQMFEEQPMLTTQLSLMGSRDLTLCQHHLMSAGRKDSHESVAFLLLELFHRAKKRIPQDFNEAENSIAFPLTQEEIGDAVGITNVHVNRIVREFMRDGLIHCQHRKLTIRNEEKLSEIGDFDIGIISSNFLI